MPTELPLLLIACLSAVAFFYASVGHGGASGYLAVLTLSGLTSSTCKPFVLCLNFSVAMAGFFHFYRAGVFRWSLFWPFALLSIPAAFFGARLKADAGIYDLLVACFLLISAFYLAFFARLAASVDSLSEAKILFRPARGIVLGALLGFISGLVGVGGGVFLSPLLVITGWAGLRQAAGVSSLFIVVNSLSGLAGLASSGLSFQEFWFLPAFPFIWLSGFLGSRWGSRLLHQELMRYLLAAVLFFASLILVLR